MNKFYLINNKPLHFLAAYIKQSTFLKFKEDSKHYLLS